MGEKTRRFIETIISIEYPALFSRRLSLVPFFPLCLLPENELFPHAALNGVIYKEKRKIDKGTIQRQRQTD